MKKNRILTVMLVVAGMLSSMPAIAGALLTTTQTQSFNFARLNDSKTLSFEGFDSTLGILRSFHFEWTLYKTLNDRVFNNGAGPIAVGDPSPLSATSTTTFTGSNINGALFSDINTLTTPGFVGIVPTGTSTVGTASALGLTGGFVFCNDGSCFPNVVTSLNGYIGGVNFLSLAIANSGRQGGSVPDEVFTGNNGTATGTVNLFYDYDLIPTTGNVPEPAILGLVGLGMAGFAASRKKKQA